MRGRRCVLSASSTKRSKRTLLSESDVFVQLSTREGLSIADARGARIRGSLCRVQYPRRARADHARAKRDGMWTIRKTCRASSRRCEQVLADRGPARAMKQACRAVAGERYSLQAMCESYWTVFTDLLRTRA